jgi:hypothetical protein
MTSEDKVDEALVDSRNGLAQEVAELRRYIRDALRRLDEGVLSGSHLMGVGAKSVDLFDAVLRELLRFYLKLASVNYDERLRKIVGSKPVNELTMGQVIVCLRTLDAEITRKCRMAASKNARHLANRRLFARRIERSLTEIIEARNQMHHHIRRFAQDEMTLARKVKSMLEHIDSVLADPLCIIPTEIPET